MIIEIDFVLILGILVTIFGIIISGLKLWNRIIMWISQMTGSELDIESLPENSPLNQAFTKIHRNLEVILENQKELRKETVENKICTKRLEIMRAVDHNVPKKEVVKLLNEYVSLPGKPNGYIVWVVESYLNDSDSFSMSDYFNCLNIKKNNNEGIK